MDLFNYASTLHVYIALLQPIPLLLYFPYKVYSSIPVAKASAVVLACFSSLLLMAILDLTPGFVFYDYLNRIDLDGMMTSGDVHALMVKGEQ